VMKGIFMKHLIIQEGVIEMDNLGKILGWCIMSILVIIPLIILVAMLIVSNPMFIFYIGGFLLFFFLVTIGNMLIKGEL